MSPITVRADLVAAANVCDDICKDDMCAAKKEFQPITHVHGLKAAHAGNRSRSGAVKLDAAFQALNEHGHRGVNHKPPHHSDDEVPVTKHGKRNARNASGRSSEESVRSSGRKSGEGRRSAEGASRRSLESQSSSADAQNNDSTDQLTQITDVLLSRLITTLSDSTLGNPALLLQTLLGFSPDDYNDLLAALSESRLSYVDIISAYLHNIKVMSEDSGSTSAALSGTLTRSLVEQYNSLLAQAVKSPQSIARANLLNDNDTRSHVIDLLQRASQADNNKPERRSFEGVPRGPSGLGFGRRHSADSAKQRSHFAAADNKPAAQSMTDTGLLELTKLFNTVPKLPVPDVNGNGNVGMPPHGPSTVGGITHEQLAALFQNPNLVPSGGATYAQQPAITPSLPFLPQPVGNMNGMLAMNLTNPYAMSQMQPWTVPMQPHQMTGAASGGLGWQAATSVGFSQPPAVFKGWGGAGLETVPENFNAQIQLQQPNLPCFSQALSLQPQL